MNVAGTLVLESLINVETKRWNNLRCTRTNLGMSFI